MILHPRLPLAPWADPRTRRLPGTQPLDMADWLAVDEVYGPQMAERDRLVATVPAAVHAVLPEAEAAAEELRATVLPRLPALGFEVGPRDARRPDGVTVPLEGPPLLVLGRLVQEDFCLLHPDGTGEHRLTGAILCFPAGWTLAEKLGRPLMRMHRPVADRYTGDVGRRVQRLMDAVRPEAPLWRMNANASRAPLHNPQPEDQDRATGRRAYPFVRCERQCLLRLPASGAVVFSIHTYVVSVEDLTPDQRASLAEHPLHGTV